MRWVALQVKAAVFWLSALAGVAIFLLRGKRPKPGLLILCYHRTAENLPSGSPYDPYNVSPAQFARQLDALEALPTVKVVSAAEVVDWICGGSTPGGSYVLITFDDGYQNTLAAAQQLQVRGMRAVFFLSTAYISERIFEPNSYDRWCSQLPGSNPLWYRPLTWADCQTMKGWGMDLQPHGHWHRLVGQLAEPDMQQEILLSKKSIEENFQCEVRAYAYAGGNRYLNHYNERVEKFLAQKGFSFALSTEAGINPPNWMRENAYHLRRVPVHEHDGGLFFQAKVAGYSGPLAALKSLKHWLRTRLGSLRTGSPMAQVKKLTYNSLVIRMVNALGLRAILRKAYYVWARPRNGIMAVKLGEFDCRFHVRTPEQLRAVGKAATGHWRIEVLQFLDHHLLPGDVVYDIGSNIGICTVFAARKVGGSGQVLAFEPAAETYAHLNDNLQLNGLGNVRAFRVALADYTGEAGLFTGDDLLYSSLVTSRNGQKKSASVRVVEGDRFRKEEELAAPNVVMIDVEGFEQRVMSGLRQTLSDPDCRVVIAEVHPTLLPSGVTDDGIVKFLYSCGFTQINTLRWKGIAEFYAIAEREARPSFSMLTAG